MKAAGAMRKTPHSRNRGRASQQAAQREMLTALLYEFARRTAQAHRGNLQAVHGQLRFINTLAQQIASAGRLSRIKNATERDRTQLSAECCEARLAGCRSKNHEVTRLHKSLKPQGRG